jgi:hypothetical protein
VNTPIPRRVSAVRTSLPLPAPPTAEEEPNVVDLAWGGEDHGQPVVLDDVPDLGRAIAAGSMPQAAQLPPTAQAGRTPTGATVPALPPVVGPAFGAALVDRAASQARWWKYALAAGVVALLGVIAIVLLTRGPSTKPTTAAPEVVKPARINFVVQPADATIEVGGQVASTQSPYEAELEAGLYTIAIRREGYKTWVTDLTVESGERQRIQVALEKGGSAQARFMIKSNPEGLAVELDGKPVEQKTPVSLDVSPGFHRIVVKDDRGQTWSEELTAEVDTQYQFQAVMGSKTQEEREQQKKLAQTRVRDDVGVRPIVGERTDPVPAPEQPTKPLAGLNTGITPTVLDTAPVTAPEPVAGTAPPPPAPAATTPSPPPAETPPPAPAPVPVATKIEPAPPPPSRPAPPPPPVKKTAKIVPPTAVTRISGTMPKIEAKIRGKNVSGDVVAKICIDESGRVSSVDVAKAAPEIKEQVHAAMKSWRYKPYLDGGQPTPACFGTMMKVKIEELQ